MSTSIDTTVYVGNIDPRVTKGQLYELFIQVAPVVKINYPKDKILQKYQGYAFIQFETEQDVEYVIKLLHNTVSLYERVLKIRKSTSNVQKVTTDGNNSNNNANDKLDPPIAKLFIKGLDESIDSKLLKSYFTKLGPFYKSPEFLEVSNNTIRCAFIYYKNYKDADEAIKKFNNQLLANKQIQVEYALKENNRSQRYGNDVDRLLNKEALKNGLL
ncbi:protein Hsh49p [Monosporozyma unispora]